MRLKCDSCGRVTAYEFPTEELKAHKNDVCDSCGHMLVSEADISLANILVDLEDKGVLLSVPAESDRSMIVIEGHNVVGVKSSEPNRIRAICEARRRAL